MTPVDEVTFDDPKEVSVPGDKDDDADPPFPKNDAVPESDYPKVSDGETDPPDG